MKDFMSELKEVLKTFPYDSLQIEAVNNGT